RPTVFRGLEIRHRRPGEGEWGSGRRGRSWTWGSSLWAPVAVPHSWGQARRFQSIRVGTGGWDSTDGFCRVACQLRFRAASRYLVMAARPVGARTKGEWVRWPTPLDPNSPTMA